MSIRKRSHVLLSSTALTALLAASAAQAGAVVDPDGTGATRVYAANGANQIQNLNQNGDLQDGRIVLGFSGLGGALELNADGTVTDYVNVNDLQIAQSGANADSLLRVVGDGTAGSVSLVVNDDFRLGANSDSRLEILDGATVIYTSEDIDDYPRAGQVIVGSYADFQEGFGNTSVLVDGAETSWEINGRLSLGFGNSFGTDDMTISGGASVVVKEPDDFAARVTQSQDVTESVTGVVSLGGDPENLVGQPLDTLTVTGAGSELVFSSGLFTNSGNNVINVLDGASLRQEERGDIGAMVAAYPDFYDEGSFGISLGAALGNKAELNVSGAGSTVSATRNVEIGYGEVWTGFDANDDPVFSPSTATVNVTDGATLQTTRNVEVSDVDGEGTGFLTVASGGTVVADTVRVNSGGVLSGNGGTIIADVVLNGGTIAPGASPGVMDIDGDLEVLAGLLSFEVGGTAPSLFDQLNISGDLLTIGKLNVEISFIDLFVPQAGDTFDFLNVGGQGPDFGDPDKVAFSFLGLGDGQDLAFDFSNGGFSARVTGGGDVSPAPVPLPASLPLVLAAFGGLAALRRRG